MPIIAERLRARVAVALLVTVAAMASCRELRRADGTLDSEPDAEAADVDPNGSGGVAPDGSGGRGTGGVEPMAGSGGEAGSPDPGAGSGGSLGSGGARAGTGGVIAVSSGGTVSSSTGGNRGSGGVTPVGSGGSSAVASGGNKGTGGGTFGSGGAMATPVDAGADGPPLCTGANHLCGNSCVSNLSVSSCGSACSMCPVPTGGGATCDGTKCGVTCNGGKVCGNKCIGASACCVDSDCGAGNKCDTMTSACQATATTLYDFNGGISPWGLYMTSPDTLAANTHLTFDSRNGEGGSGALKVDAPFDGGNQKVEFQDTQSTMLNLKGRTLHARVRLGSGLSDDTAHPGAIKLFAKSGANYDYASGVWTNLLGTGWADVKLSADTPDFVQGSFASDQVRQVGFELRVFSNTQRPTAAVVFIDNVGY